MYSTTFVDNPDFWNHSTVVLHMLSLPNIDFLNDYNLWLLLAFISDHRWYMPVGGVYMLYIQLCGASDLPTHYSIYIA